jgi:RPA family protein
MEQQLRQTAHKVWISDLLNKQIQKEEGEWSPNYISIDNKRVSRVNIVATVVMKSISDDKSYATLTIDDSSSDIQIKAWKEDIVALENVDIGDTVLFIGRVREYNSQIYLTPEIVKPLEKSEWLDLRKKELEVLYGNRTTQIPEIKQEVKEETKQPESIVIEEETVSSDKETKNERQKILNIIESLDKNEGADIIEVIEASKILEDEANLVIQELLKEGEIFEIKAGKLKIIE